MSEFIAFLLGGFLGLILGVILCCEKLNITIVFKPIKMRRRRRR